MSTNLVFINRGFVIDGQVTVRVDRDQYLSNVGVDPTLRVPEKGEHFLSVEI